MMNFKEAGRELSEKTKPPKFKREPATDSRAVEDEEQRELERKWRGLVKSGEAILRLEILRRHAIRLQDFEPWFVRHVENEDLFTYGKHFFKFSNGDYALLVETDDQIASGSIEKLLGDSAERYEDERLRKRTHAEYPQTHAPDWNPFSVLDGEIQYYD